MLIYHMKRVCVSNRGCSNPELELRPEELNAGQIGPAPLDRICHAGRPPGRVSKIAHLRINAAVISKMMAERRTPVVWKQEKKKTSLVVR